MEHELHRDLVVNCVNPLISCKISALQTITMCREGEKQGGKKLVTSSSNGQIMSRRTHTAQLVTTAYTLQILTIQKSETGKCQVRRQQALSKHSGRRSYLQLREPPPRTRPIEDMNNQKSVSMAQTLATSVTNMFLQQHSGW